MSQPEMNLLDAEAKELCLRRLLSRVVSSGACYFAPGAGEELLADLRRELEQSPQPQDKELRRERRVSFVQGYMLGLREGASGVRSVGAAERAIERVDWVLHKMMETEDPVQLPSDLDAAVPPHPDQVKAFRRMDTGE